MQAQTNFRKPLCIGLLAHVDAGKTTLSEGLLYAAGARRVLGRVDHGDALLDSFQLERQRGITIFSKQARLRTAHRAVTLIDTPGHVDFAAETERVLPALDCAVLVISGTDGVQAHTRTLWQLLRKHQVPVFLFINKMDLPGADRDKLLAQLQKELSESCVDFTGSAEAIREAAAMCDEALLESFLEGGAVTDENLRQLIAQCRLFPVYFGAALKNEGVDALLAGLDTYAPENTYGDAFSARVYKITRDPQGNRLTWMKLTGGSLSVREPVRYENRQGETLTEKAAQLRLYSGEKFETPDRVEAGTAFAVTGLTATWAGQGLGAEAEIFRPELEPVMTYRAKLPPKADPSLVLPKLRQLEEEDPQLHIAWDGKQIGVQIMGQVQLEVFQSLVKQRFDLDITLDDPKIFYKETISDTVEGVGHFEPLRHYAEVHLLLEPGAPGSGLVFDTQCPQDVLDAGYQSLILTHLAEKQHRGVLIGAPITDMKITLLIGKAHLKHTEGGDFREATYRAVRQGLRMAESILLEPWCRFTLTVPAEQLGRAIHDIQQREAETEPPELLPETATLRGTAALDALRDYPAEVLRYTRGRGRLSWEPDGYAPCRRPEEVIAAYGYDCNAANTADSVFCSRGAGHTVRWDEVPGMAHIQTNVLKADEEPEEPAVTRQRSEAYRGSLLQDKELMRIFEMTYGPIKRRSGEALHTPKPTGNSPKPGKAAPLPEGPEYLLADGYNIIFAWEELAELAKTDLDAARHRLIQILCNYQGYRRCELILVFDAYKVKGNPGSIERHHGISVVYTKEAETADMYIEKVTHTLAKEHRVRVATSDGLEQIIILGHGAIRVPARQFQEEVRQVEEAIREILESL